jgi:Spy/CpxP family protein refolding chaperone
VSKGVETKQQKMKKLLLASLAAAFALTTYSQTSDAEADALANLLGVQKREAIAKLVLVPSKDSAAFWKVYNEYQKINVSTGKERIRLYERTANAYNILTPGLADSLSKVYFKNRIDQENTLQEYYGKIKNATNAVLAFEFYQAEVYLLTHIRAQIMQQIPTYGEFMKSVKNR